MENKLRGKVEIDIGGSTRLLRYDMNALAELEQSLGKPVGKIFEEDNIGIHVLRETLYIGLKAFNKKITPSKVGMWMEPDKLEYYGEIVGSAVAVAMGVDVKEEGEDVDVDGVFAEDSDDASDPTEDSPTGED